MNQYKAEQCDVRCGGYGWPGFDYVRICRKGTIFGLIDSSMIKRRVNRTIRRKQRQRQEVDYDSTRFDRKTKENGG